MSLKYGILGLINYEPMTGYKIKKIFDKSINHIWEASLSQIYRELAALEKGGYVQSFIEEQEDRPDKRIYRITEEGKREFLCWLSECPDKFISPKRDEFMLKMCFGASLGKYEVRKYLEMFIEDRKKAILEMNENQKAVARLSKIVDGDQPEQKKEVERYMNFILKRAQMSNNMLVQWAEECIKELEE